MNQAQYKQYSSYGIAEYAADTKQFASYISYLSSYCPKNEILALLNVLLDHYLHTPFDNRAKALKMKELIAILLVFADLDGSAAITISKCNYDLGLLKSIFSFALAYSNKKLKSMGVTRISKLLSFIILAYSLDKGTSVEELSWAEKTVRQVFENSVQSIDAGRIQEEICAGVLCAKKILLENSSEAGHVINLLQEKLKKIDTANTEEIVQSAQKVIKFYEEVKSEPEVPEVPFEELMKVPVMTEPMVIEEIKPVEVPDFPIITAPIKEAYDDIKSLLLRSTCISKYNFLCFT